MGSDTTVHGPVLETAGLAVHREYRQGDAGVE